MCVCVCVLFAGGGLGKHLRSSDLDMSIFKPLQLNQDHKLQRGENRKSFSVNLILNTTLMFQKLVFRLTLYGLRNAPPVLFYSNTVYFTLYNEYLLLCVYIYIYTYVYMCKL